MYIMWTCLVIKRCTHYVALAIPNVYQQKAMLHMALHASAWMGCAVVHKPCSQCLCTSAPKQLLFGKTFGTCQSNIIFVEFASLKTIFRRIPGVVSIQI